MSDSRVAGAQLSPREKECVVLIAEGFGHKEIAGRMRISESTVRKYLRDAGGKAFGRDTTNVVYFTRYAVSMGWVGKEWEVPG